MTSAHRILVVIVSTTLAAPWTIATARAQSSDDAPGGLRPSPSVVTPTPPPPSAATPVIPDASLRAMQGSWVALDFATRPPLVGRLAGFEADTVTLVLSGSNEVVTIPRSAIVRLRGLTPTEPGHAGPGEAAAPEPSGPPRSFGVNFGVTPSVMLDVDYNLFYGFLNVNLVFPLATASSSHPWWTGSVGAGVSLPVSKNSRWKFDIFGSVLPLAGLESSKTYVSIGVGLGMHYTFPSGFTVAFKLPALGYTVRTCTYDCSNLDSGEAFAYYFLASAMGLPIVSVGYRF